MHPFIATARSATEVFTVHILFAVVKELLRTLCWQLSLKPLSVPAELFSFSLALMWQTAEKCVAQSRLRTAKSQTFGKAQASRVAENKTNQRWRQRNMKDSGDAFYITGREPCIFEEDALQSVEQRHREAGSPSVAQWSKERVGQGEEGRRYRVWGPPTKGGCVCVCGEGESQTQHDGSLCGAGGWICRLVGWKAARRAGERADEAPGSCLATLIWGHVDQVNLICPVFIIKATFKHPHEPGGKMASLNDSSKKTVIVDCWLIKPHL